MANRKKKDEALAVVQAQTEGSGQPAVQSGYSSGRQTARAIIRAAIRSGSTSF